MGQCIFLKEKIVETRRLTLPASRLSKKCGTKYIKKEYDLKEISQKFLKNLELMNLLLRINTWLNWVKEKTGDN